MCTDEVQRITVPAVNIPEGGIADARGFFQHGVKYGLRIARRTADNLKHLRGRGLLLQRVAEVGCSLTQFVEESRVLDGDDGLGGEVSYEFNLLIGEKAHLLTINSDYTD